MKKADRKEAYTKVTNALIAGNNELAYNEMVSLMADDVDLFALTSYKSARERFEAKKLVAKIQEVIPTSEY